MIIYQHGTFWRPGASAPNAALEPGEPIEAAALPPNPWWTGKRLPCGFCTCVFGVEAADVYTTACLPYLFAPRPEGRPAQLRLSVLCPECHLMNRFCESDAEAADPFDPVEGEDMEEDCLL